MIPESCMQRKDVPMLHERAATQLPTLYVCPVENVLRLGRVPLIPCYLNGNAVNTIPHCFRSKTLKEAATDSRPDSGTGRTLFEIDMCIRKRWTFPREFSVEQAVAMHKKRVQESRLPGHKEPRLFGAGMRKPEDLCSAINAIGICISYPILAFDMK